MTDLPSLRDRIAAAIDECRTLIPSAQADAVLAILPAPVGRAAILAEAIVRVEDPEERAKSTIGRGLGWEAARDVLRRMAAEAETDPEAQR